MSTRRTERTLDARVAQLEEWVRRLKADTAVYPTDPRFLHTARGDVLVADGPADPVPLAVGTLADVLTMGTAQLPEWKDPDRIKLSSVALKGVLFVGRSPGRVTALAPGPDGQVLTADSTRPEGVRWA